MDPFNTIEFLENERDKYQKQKNALEKQHYPSNQEESKQLLLKFYTEKIAELNKSIERKTTSNIKKAMDMEFEGETIQANPSKRPGS